MTNYTIADLCALNNSALTRIAEELRGFQVSIAAHSPIGRCCTDFNQSRELLTWAINEHDCSFNISIGDEPFIEFTWPDAPEMLSSRNGADWREIPGDSARAETIAFCAAMLAMAGRLKEGK